MKQRRTTVVLQERTAKQLKNFSRRSGISQTALINRILARGLEHLDAKWRSAEELLDDVYAGSEQRKGRV